MSQEAPFTEGFEEFYQCPDPDCQTDLLPNEDGFRALHKLGCSMPNHETYILNERALLVQKIESYTGLPTLEYDKIIDELTYKVEQLEQQLMHTCEACGGEVQNDFITVIHIPENGWCAQELDDCSLYQEVGQ